MCSCLEGLAKLILNIINVCFFICGAALLGIGIWLLVDDSAVRWLNDLEMEITFGSDDAAWATACGLIIGVGCFLFVIGFCGCCGVRQKNSCLLLVYIISVTSVIILQVIAVVAAIVYNSQVGDLLMREMRTNLRTHFNKDETSDDPTTLAWNTMQFELQCCGASGYEDWFGSEFSAETTNPVPYSCCVTNENVESPGSPADVADLSQCYAEARRVPADLVYTALYPEGCYYSIRDALMRNMYIVIGICVGVLILEVFGLWIACRVRDNIKKPYK